MDISRAKENRCVRLILIVAGLYVILQFSITKIYHCKEATIVWNNNENDGQPKAENERSAIKKMNILTSKQASEILQRLSDPPPIYHPSAVNIYDISNITVIDTSLCVKTRTPSVFIICTWELQKDQYVSGDIHRTGQWEPDITRKIYDVLHQTRKVTFIDIGANMGYYSLLAASIGHHVVSVEPWEQHIYKFAKSIHLNNFEDRITLINNAVSNKREVVRMDVPWPNNQGAAMVISENAPAKNGFYVKSIILDDLISFVSTKDVVIKIDIEGYECRALEMSDELFEKFNVLFISMEWSGMELLKGEHDAGCPAKNTQQLKVMLTRRGFVPYSFIDNKQLDINNHEIWTPRDVYWKPTSF